MSGPGFRAAICGTVLCCVLGIGVRHAAADVAAEGYVVLRAVGSFSLVKDVRQSSAGQIEIRHDEDLVASLGIAAGRSWTIGGVRVRGELEYHHRARFDFDVRVYGGTDAGFENQLRTDAVLANVYYDITPWHGIQPYIGFGLGWVHNTSEVDRVPLSGSPKEERRDSTDSLGWAAMLGAFVDLSEHWRFELGYRYMDLGDVESGPFRDGTVIKARDYTTHDVVLGFLYRF